MTSNDHSYRPPGLSSRWRRRFTDAVDGLWIACRTQESLWVHLAFAVLVPCVAAILQVEAWQWCALILCIALVIALELLNTAIERLVKTLHPDHDAGIAEVLHMSAAAALVGATGSVFVGLIVIIPKFFEWLK